VTQFPYVNSLNIGTYQQQNAVTTNIPDKFKVLFIREIWFLIEVHRHFVFITSTRCMV